MHYAFTTAQVVAMFQAAFDCGSNKIVENAKNQLEAANNAGCPLS